MIEEKFSPGCVAMGRICSGHLGLEEPSLRLCLDSGLKASSSSVSELSDGSSAIGELIWGDGDRSSFGRMDSIAVAISEVAQVAGCL